MLTLCGGQVESLWDEVLPVEVRELPDDLARLDRVLSDELLLFPIAQAWAQGARERGRPSISIATFVRLMVIKQRTGWGYETLVREVSDSLHLRRFCLIGIDQRVPDESTVRKLARRLGAEVVAEITRMVIEKAQRETRFTARAARIDSTVVEADIRYPSDAMLALQGARTLAREGKKVQKLVGGRVRVSIADPDARPIRKGKLGKPTEFGYVAQICEITENTRKGARGLILPAGHELGNPAENKLLPRTAVELGRAGIRPREIVLDGGFMPGPTRDAFPELAEKQIHISGRHEPGSRRTRKRRARYRTGVEGRISHLKRGYGLRRSRLKGDEGMQIWTGWAILAYDLDTLAIRTR